MGEHIITRTTMVINLRITHVVVVRTDHVVTIVAVVVPIADQDNHKPLFIILASNNFTPLFLFCSSPFNDLSFIKRTLPKHTQPVELTKLLQVGSL